MELFSYLDFATVCETLDSTPEYICWVYHIFNSVDEIALC